MRGRERCACGNPARYREEANIVAHRRETRAPRYPIGANINRKIAEISMLEQNRIHK